MISSRLCPPAKTVGLGPCALPSSCNRPCYCRTPDTLAASCATPGLRRSRPWCKTWPRTPATEYVRVSHHTVMQALYIPAGLYPKQWREYLGTLDTEITSDANVKKLITQIVADMMTVKEAEEMFDHLDRLFSRVSKYNKG